jgi:hypothetical protein
MNKTEQNLTDLNVSQKQLRAIPLILGAKTIEEGVKKAGISKTTFYKWQKSHEFKEEFMRHRREIVDFALHELKISTVDAVRVLKRLLKAKSEWIRLRTALGILDYVSKFIEQEDISRRLEELEIEFEKEKKQR